MTPSPTLDLKVLPIDLTCEVVPYAIEDHLSGPMKVKITGSKWGHACIKVSLFSRKVSNFHVINSRLKRGGRDL